jgi:hypothetical protein
VAAALIADQAAVEELRATHPGLRSLLRLGADPAIRDQRFDSTPLGWARYFGHEQLVTLLEPLTAPEEP